MAMNKAEKARLEEALTQAALRWTSPVEPDVEPPLPDAGSFGLLSKGFTFNAYTLRVEPACSSYHSHGIGGHDKTTMQRSIRLYSTAERAARAMRAEMERQFAKKLREVDRIIEKETAITHTGAVQNR